MACVAGNPMIAGQIVSTAWDTNVTITSLIMSMTVNALVTGLIVFRIFKVFRKVKGTITFDGKSSCSGGAGGRNIRYVMFVLIESGIALFSIQLARVVPTAFSTDGTSSEQDLFNFMVSCHEMLNVTKTTSGSLLAPFLLITWAWLGYSTYHHPGADIDGIIFPRRDIFDRSGR